MPSSIRARSRFSHHQSQIGTSTSLQQEYVGDPSTTIQSQYHSSSTKHHHRTSLHNNTVADDEPVLNYENTASGNSFDIVFLDKTNVDPMDKVDIQEEGKKKKSFLFRNLRMVQNFLASSKKVIIFFVFGFFLFLILHLKTTSLGNHSDAKLWIENLLKDSVGEVSDHPIKALGIYICLYVTVLCKFHRVRFSRLFLFHPTFIFIPHPMFIYLVHEYHIA